jgi:hypothetical protein
MRLQTIFYTEFVNDRSYILEYSNSKHSLNFQLDSPLSAERIRMACEDHLTQKVPKLPEEGSYKPWGIQV